MAAMPRNAISVTDKVGWRVNEWADAIGLGRAFTYQLISEGKINSVRIGGARIITTAPADYLRMCKETDATVAAPDRSAT
jgi:hypothetical protein